MSRRAHRAFFLDVEEKTRAVELLRVRVANSGGGDDSLSYVCADG